MLLLIDTRDRAPEPEPEDERPQRAANARASLPRLPWRGLAWIALFAGLLVLAAAVEGVAGYGIFLLDIALGSWRLDRWAGRLHVGRAGDSGAWY